MIDQNTARLTVDGIGATRETYIEYDTEDRHEKTRHRYIFAEEGE